VRLQIRSHPSVYPGVPYTLTLDAPLVERLRNSNRHELMSIADWATLTLDVPLLERLRKTNRRELMSIASWAGFCCTTLTSGIRVGGRKKPGETSLGSHGDAGVR
jgi:hypothetical protein